MAAPSLAIFHRMSVIRITAIFGAVFVLAFTGRQAFERLRSGQQFGKIGVSIPD